MLLILISVCAILCALFEKNMEMAEIMVYACCFLFLLVEAMNIGEYE
jgi:hypothetical protein